MADDIVWDDDIIWDDDPSYEEYIAKEHPYAQKLEQEYAGTTRKDMSEYAPEPISDYPPMLKGLMVPAHGAKVMAEGAMEAVKGLTGLMYVDPTGMSEEEQEAYAKQMTNLMSFTMGGSSLAPTKGVGVAANKIGYHGGVRNPKFAKGRPAFFTKKKGDAEWYADNRGGHISEWDLDLKKSANFDDLMEAATEAGVTAKDIPKHSPYSGDNPIDFLYVPEVQANLKAKGFDSYKGSDVLGNSEIDILVALDPKLATRTEPTTQKLHSMIPSFRTPKPVREFISKAFKKSTDDVPDFKRNKQLYEETGYWYGEDGYWRYEIDPNQMKVKDQAKYILDGEMKLSDAIDYPDMFKAMPEMKDVKLKVVADWDGIGQFNPTTNTIKVKNINEVDTMLHEVQHGINKQKGAFSGSNTDWELKKHGEMIYDKLDSDTDPIVFLPNEVVSTIDGLASAFKNADIERANMLIRILDNDARGRGANLSFAERELLGDFIDSSVGVGFPTYMAVPGEMEARLVMKRLNMSNEERKAIPPWETLDSMAFDEFMADDILNPKAGLNLY